MSSLRCCQALPASDFLARNQITSEALGARSLPQSCNAAAARRKICCSQRPHFAIETKVAAAERIKTGFQKFKAETYTQNPELFNELANGQSPKFMVIACSDSRVCPTTVLGFQPGEAFVVRNVANMVPPPEQAGYPGTSAALEYAVTALKVENILVIGHSRCGGIKALMTRKENAAKWSAFIEDWIEIGRPARASTLKSEPEGQIDHQCTKCEKESVNVSLSNLLGFPFVKEAVTSGKVALHGGYYNFVDGAFEYWTFGADGKPGEISKF
ncbi:carbonic anhydrase 2 [Selaginella moellendorffii]|uniref:carbonic anhydrase 2 n=1 Tax=Selaginella moellendorffii TaxID=88036 RepID=UPI000D1C9851|nr:carbonic anhydrase 2 [Selaginella moellendorffii]|eukprot:XP_002971798.2 carbonic anhydrase 2 [Selaginella moellendorffii]